MDRERLFVELFLQFNLLQLNCFDLHHQLLGLLLVLFLPGFLFAIMLFVLIIQFASQLLALVLKN